MAIDSTPSLRTALELAFTHANDSAFVVSVGESGDFRYLMWNRTCEAISGLTAQDVEGRTPQELFGAQGEHFAAQYSACVRAQAPTSYEEQLVFQGEKMTASTALFPIFDGGRVVALLGMAANIGIGRAKERALKESEARYRQLVESLREGVWAIDGAGVTTFANPAMAKMLGYSVEEMIGRHLFSFMTDEAKALAAQNMERRAQGISEQHEFEFIHREGRPVLTLLETSPLFDADQRNVGALAGVLDITALRQAERERADLQRKMLDTQRLESMGLLSGGIAHDFNNLLTVILTAASLGKEAPGSPRELFDNIEQAGRRAAELCNQLLAYSGRGKFQVTDVNLSELVLEVSELVRLSIRKTASLDFDLAREGVWVTADPSQLRQILVNLVINASEALGDSGHITVRTRVQRLHEPLSSATPEVVPGSYAVLEVSDDGAGMAQAQLARVFDPFYTTKFTGRGLGLAAVMGIVRSHSGGVVVRSELGAGSTFEVYLPSSAASAVLAPPSVPRLTAPEFVGRGLVLVVDDEDLVRRSVVHVVKRLGFETVEARDGLEGVRRYEVDAARVRCVFLDLTMPQLDGAATFRRIRELNAEVPVLLMSGFDAAEAMARFPELKAPGPQRFVHKPFVLGDIREALRSLLG